MKRISFGFYWKEIIGGRIGSASRDFEKLKNVMPKKKFGWSDCE